MAVKHDEANHVFWLELEGVKEDDAPRVEYAILGKNKWNFHHTETPPALQGKGYAGKVVGHALSYAKEHNIDVSSSTCSYVQAQIQKQKL